MYKKCNFDVLSYGYLMDMLWISYGAHRQFPLKRVTFESGVEVFVVSFGRFIAQQKSGKSAYWIYFL